MKHFGKLIALGAVLAVSATYAHAIPVTYSTSGVFSASGTSAATFGSGGNTVTLTFLPITSTSLSAPTFASAGDIVSTVAGTGASASGNFTLTISQTVPSVGSGSVVGTLSGSFTTNSSTGLLNFSNLTVNLGSVIYTLQQPTNGYFLVPPMSGGGDTTLQMAITPTPEPSSLMLLGTGLLSAGGMLMRRRRLTA